MSAMAGTSSAEVSNQCCLKIVAFLKTDELFPRVQDLVQRVCQEGHQIIVFGEQMVPIFGSHTDYRMSYYTPYPTSEEYLNETLPSADVLILLTLGEEFFHDIPASVRGFVKKRFYNQSYFSWRAYGFTCSLIGGFVHSRKVAMNLRQLLDDSDYPFFGRVLPEPRFFSRCYDVDPACETGQPCVL